MKIFFDILTFVPFTRQIEYQLLKSAYLFQMFSPLRANYRLIFSHLRRPSLILVL